MVLKIKMNKEKSIRQQYEILERKKIISLLISIAATVILGVYFTTLGIADTNLKQVFSAISLSIKSVLNLTSQEIGSSEKIIVLMRLPRIAMAIIAGAGMATAGSAMQAVTRNPLVSPFTIGISSAAAFGASICIVFAQTPFFKSEAGIIFSAFSAAILCMIIVYSVSGKMGMSSESVILTGIALNYFFSAATSAVEFFAQEHRLAAVVQWTFGTFNGIVWREAIVSSCFVITGVLILQFNSQKLGAMASGDDELVESLGINTKRIRVITGAVSVLMTAAIISFTGVIGFVGLVAPHIARIIVGNDYKFLLPFSAVTGALLLMISDAVGKTILSPVSIPVGIVVSFLGVPLFIHLILRQRRGGE